MTQRLTYPCRNRRIASLNGSPLRSAASSAFDQSESSTRRVRTFLGSAISQRPNERVAATQSGMVRVGDDVVNPLAVKDGGKRFGDLGAKRKGRPDLFGVDLADAACALDLGHGVAVVAHVPTLARVHTFVNTPGVANFGDDSPSAPPQHYTFMLTDPT